MNKNRTMALALWAIGMMLWLAACQSGENIGASESTEPDVATATIRTTDVQPTATATREAATLPTPRATRALPTAAPTITPTATVEPTPPPLGASERPIQLLFPPVANSAVIAQRGAALAEALQAATGYEFAVGIADSEEVLVDLLCSAPEDVLGFASAAAYTIASEECDAQAGLVAVQEDGFTWQTGMIVIRPGGAATLADLAGKRWAVADTRSLSNYLYFRAQMAEAGIEPGEIVAAPEETSALLALVNEQVDFTTASFVPPIMPQSRTWVYGETDPEEWRLLGIAPSRSPIGYVIVAGEPEFGGYRLRDARARLFDTTPEIFNQTRILALSEPIPNETVVLGADFPPDLAGEILTAMTTFAASGACQTSLCSADFFGWAGLEPADDADYDPIRAIKDTLELEAADLWAELD
jgi:phosphonate transport system substrate-binding protein